MRKSMRKKLFAILLTLCMVLTMMPSAVFATSGTTGNLSTRTEYDYSEFEGTMIHDYSMGVSTIYGEQWGANDDIIATKNCKITGMESSDIDIVKIDKNGEIFDIVPGNAGTATVTITHEGFDNTEVTKDFEITVVNSKWFCDVYSPTGSKSMLPGGSTTLSAKAYYAYVKEYENGEKWTEEDHNKSYIAKWSLANDNQTGITLTNGNDNKSVVVKADADILNNTDDVYVPIKLDIYDTDESVNEDRPVLSTTCDCRVEKQFYTMEVSGLKPEFYRDERMTLTPSVKKHFLNEEGKEITSDVATENVKFDWGSCSNLSVDVINNGSNDAKYVITRNSNGEVKLELWGMIKEQDSNGEHYRDFSTWVFFDPYEEENWCMVCSDKVVTSADASSETLSNYLHLPGEKNSKEVYLYLVKDNNGELDYRSLIALDTNSFDIRYNLPETTPGEGPTSSENKGLSIVKKDGTTNCYTITSDNTKQPDYAAGTKNYDVWPKSGNCAGKNICNFEIITSENLDVEGWRAMFFTREPITNENNLPDIVERLTFNIEPETTSVSEEVYAYVADYAPGDVGRYLNIQPINDGIVGYYVKNITDNGPEYDREDGDGDRPPIGKGLTIDQIGENSNKYRITVDASAYSGFTEGRRVYELYPANEDAAQFELLINKVLAPSADETYSISLEMLVDPSIYNNIGDSSTDYMRVYGQGNAMWFTNKINSWYTCFYVKNNRTGEDARFDPQQGDQEERTYIGGAEDFVIEAQKIDVENGQGGWIEQSTLDADYNVFNIEYIGSKKGFNPVFKVSYSVPLEQLQTALEQYRYRIRYTGNDPYLRSGNPENNGFTIDLTLENPADFVIDEYKMYGPGSWGGSNWHAFHNVGSKQYMKMIIRPDDLKGIAEGKLYDEKDYIFMDNEIENLKLFRTEYNEKNNEWERIDINWEDSPFSISWKADEVIGADNVPNGCYVITYDKPEKDIYGPEYQMEYTGKWDDKINAKFGYDANTVHSVGNECRMNTGKLTVRAEDRLDGDTVKARIRGELNATEVIFGETSLNGLSEVNIETNHGNISFNQSVINSMNAQSGEVSFEIRDLKKDSYGLTDAQKSVLEDCDIAFDFSIKSASNKVEFGDNGKAKIEIPFGDNTKAVYYLDENGKLHSVECTLDGEHVAFSAEHFSTYVVADKGLEEKTMGTATLSGSIDKTYDGNAIDPTELTLTKNNLEGDVSFEIYSDEACTEVLSKAPKDAGEYWIRAIVAESEDYTSAISNAVKVIVSPKIITSSNLEYTGAAITKSYDNTTDCSLTTVSVKSGILAEGDTLVVNGTAVYNSANVATATKVTFTPDAIETGNYRLSADQTLDIDAAITEKSVTITGLVAEDKVYDGNDDATTTGGTISGLVEGDTVAIVAGTAKFDNKNVGENKDVTFSGYSLKGQDAGNYVLSAQPANVKATITKANVNGKPEIGIVSEAGKTLNDVEVNIANDMTSGTFAWNDAGDTVVEANKSYGWTYTPDDNVNYAVLTGNATPYVVSSGGGGGGAIIPPTPEKPADEPVQSGSTTSTDLSGSTVNKGGQTTTTMDKTVADKIVDTAVTNKSEEVVINTITKNDSAAQSVKSAEVTLPAETLGAIAEKTDANVVIKTDVAEVKLDNKTAEAIAQQAAAVGATEAVSIKAEKVKEEAKEVRFELKITTSSGAVISDFKGGNVSVTVNVPQSLANKKIVCVYIDENGKYHKVDGAINEEGTQYTFTTGHFSTYAVMSEEDAEAVIKKQTADEQKAKIKNVKATVTLSTKDLKKGIRVTVKVPDDQKADKTGIIIYRSTSKNAKTYAVYKKVATKKSTYIIRNTKNVKGQKLTAGKKYYYKVRAYKVIDGKTYYGPMSEVKYIKAK